MKLIISMTLLCFVIVKSYYFRSENWEPDRDLPEKNDFDTFMKPVETLVNYVEKNLTRLQDIHLVLGIFLSNVHLGRVLLDKGQSLPSDVYTRIKAAIDTNEKNLNYFRNKTISDVTYLSRDYTIISFLMSNTTYSINRLKKFNYEKMPDYTKNDVLNIYSDWESYFYKVDDVYRWQPNPSNSDICLVSVAVNPRNMNESFISWCPVAKLCYDIVSQGNDFGYALCHRIIILAMANLGQGCAILSATEDEALISKLCKMAYAEATYIAFHNSAMADLMFEIICVCALDGKAQFLRRNWLLRLLSFQHDDGCFGYFDTETKVCNSHTGALASGSYSAAVRFIVEEFY